MALIQCASCGKEVSDKALKCPACGYQLIEDTNEANSEKEVVVCEECGIELSEDAESCPNCGCPVTREKPEEINVQKVEVAGVDLKVNKNIKKFALLAVAAVIVIAIVAYYSSSIKEKRAAEEYQNMLNSYESNLESACYTMLSGASEAESAGNLIKSVWHNSIYENTSSETDKFTKSNGGYGSFYDDFNIALGNLFSDDDFSDTITLIELNRSTVDDLMKRLKNPPEEFEDAYDALKECYSVYSEFTGMVISPSGSLQTFSTAFSETDSEMLAAYNSLKLYVED